MNDMIQHDTNELPEVPVRKCPYRAVTGFEELRDRGPLTQARLPDGRRTWVVTDHATARELLADPRLSSSRNHPNSPLVLPAREDSGPGRSLLGDTLIGVEGPEHNRQRRMVIPNFSLKRIASLRTGIQRIVDEHLDAMLDAGPEADLVEAFALPVPSRVICELLGVPYSDHTFFEQKSRLRFDPEHGAAAVAELWEYLVNLVRTKVDDPGGGLLDDLIATGELDESQVASFGIILLIAGHDTTANMITLGTVALLEHPDQLAALRAEPELMPGAVEELLRYISLVPGLPRVATDDIEIDGRTIRADDGVLVGLGMANTEAALFPEPRELDVRRKARGHLAFGHGIHQCLGQNLARAELEIAFTALFSRIPTLRLDGPVDEVPRSGLSLGLPRLMVSW